LQLQQQQQQQRNRAYAGSRHKPRGYQYTCHHYTHTHTCSEGETRGGEEEQGLVGAQKEQAEAEGGKKVAKWECKNTLLQWRRIKKDYKVQQTSAK